MSKRELTRHDILQRLIDKRLTQQQAAAILALSVRQVKRLAKAYRKDGASGLISKRRGRPSNNQLSLQVKEQATDLIRSTYHDFGPTLAHEKLVETHGLRLSRESVRQVMVAEGLWQAKRAKRPTIYQLRERRACYGELLQIDGSPHDWFEGRAPACTLLVFIDDATGRLMQLLFVEAETTFAYFAALRQYFAQHGRPVALYSDKFGVFRVNIPNALSGTGLTQFGRAMQELSIELICANTPQAKGRVERANQTLQDRLVKELRLRNISTTEEANAYVPEFTSDFNRRFAVVPRSTADVHRPAPSITQLDRIFTLVEKRVLSKNLTLSYNKVIYQITTARASYTMRGAQVEVRENEAGEIHIEYKGQWLAFSIDHQQERQIDVTPSKLIDAALRTPPAKTKGEPYHPPANHPWRRFDYSERSMQAMERRGDICILRK